MTNFDGKSEVVILIGTPEKPAIFEDVDHDLVQYESADARSGSTHLLYYKGC
jgi:hypothetical protein